MLEAVLRRAAERAGDQRTLARAGVEAAGLAEQLLTGRGLELAPERPGPAQEREVVGMLVVREADDTSTTAGGAQGVAARKGFEAEDLLAPPGEMRGRGAPVGAEADDDIAHRGTVANSSRKRPMTIAALGMRSSRAFSSGAWARASGWP